MEIIDLSHQLETGIQVYPGDPQVYIQEGLTHEKHYCHVDRLHLGTHSGTHIDAPLHFIPRGKAISQFPIQKFVAEGILIDVTGKAENQPVTPEDILPYENKLPQGGFVVIMTGWDKFFNTPKYERHPYLGKKAAQILRDKEVSIVAIDALNIDSTVRECWDAHETLLSKDILIVENLTHLWTLDPTARYLFSFLPLKLKNTDGSPVRAAAIKI